MPSNSWGVIFCPKQGGKMTKKRWNAMRSYMTSTGITYDYVQSEGPGSIERLASMMTRAGYTTIVIVGGDSALNHALNGVMKTDSPTGHHPALGVIPDGFGNDFSRFWGFDSDDYKSTIDALARHQTRRVDVGTLVIDHVSPTRPPQKLYFLNCVNLGVASAITNLRRKTKSFFSISAISYLISALLLIFQRNNFRFDFSTSGERIVQNAMSVCVGSALGYGQTPSAVPYNGLLDVTLVSKPPLFRIAQGVWLLFTSRFLSHRGVKVWRTKQIKFTDTSHAGLSLDGRVYHHKVKAIDIGIKPEEIDFLIKS